MIDTIRGLNWLDLIVIILLIRIVYIAVEKGPLLEIFKGLGVLTAILLSCYYYNSLGEYIAGKVPLPIEAASVFSFIVLCIFGYLLLAVIRGSLFRLVRKESKSAFLSKWLGGLFGIARGFLTVGLLVLILNISGVEYLSTSVKKSLVASRFQNVATGVYRNVWDGVISKINPNAVSNPGIFQFE